MCLKLKTEQRVRKVENKIEDAVKRYMTKGKMVTLVRTVHGYAFKIQDKCNKKDYFSKPYEMFEECEKDSYKVAKSI